MFDQSRWKIVAAILLVLTLVLGGTFCVIYWASYTEMSSENRSMLREYVSGYSLQDEKKSGQPGHYRPGNGPAAPPRLELSTFYSVAVADNGEILRVDTADVASLDADSLRELAVSILDSGRTEGIEHSLMYLVAEKDGYQLVAFLDFSFLQESTRTLLNYTLVFGGVALVPLFLLAWYLAGRIVSPLEESYRRQKQFISDASHELKTPVAVIGANIELLSRELEDDPWLANIRYENARMAGLIAQLLDLARTEAVSPVMAEIDLSRLVLGEVLPFETVAFEHGVRLETCLDDAVCLVGNDIQLKQLVSILVDNAIRHSPAGEAVTIRLLQERGHALLAVTNIGPEIPPEQQKHVFDRFYRGDEVRSDSHHYGLGLATAKAIADSHHGTIQVRCADGQVSFLVRFPLQGHGRRH